jgi:hypothetical protein
MIRRNCKGVSFKPAAGPRDGPFPCVARHHAESGKGQPNACGNQRHKAGGSVPKWPPRPSTIVVVATSFSIRVWNREANLRIGAM